MFRHAPLHALVVDVADDRPRGLLAWFLAWLQQVLCALHGHDTILQYERNRMFLRCTSCGYETPGWDVSNVNANRVESHAPMTAPRDLAVARKIA